MFCKLCYSATQFRFSDQGPRFSWLQHCSEEETGNSESHVNLWLLVSSVIKKIVLVILCHDYIIVKNNFGNICDDKLIMQHKWFLLFAVASEKTFLPPASPVFSHPTHRERSICKWDDFSTEKSFCLPS